MDRRRQDGFPDEGPRFQPPGRQSLPRKKNTTRRKKKQESPHRFLAGEAGHTQQKNRHRTNAKSEGGGQKPLLEQNELRQQPFSHDEGPPTHRAGRRHHEKHNRFQIRNDDIRIIARGDGKDVAKELKSSRGGKTKLLVELNDDKKRPDEGEPRSDG